MKSSSSFNITGEILLVQEDGAELLLENGTGSFLAEISQ